MEIEIGSCPACGGACKWLDDGDLIECQELDGERERKCGYVFVDVYGSKRSTTQAYNELSRIAGIGRRVLAVTAKGDA